MRYLTRPFAVGVAGLVLAAAVVMPGAQRAYSSDDGTYITTLREAAASLPVAEEMNAGYQRTSFRHWIDEDADGCVTRSEVLQEESQAPVISGPGCKIISGMWLSYYDGATISDPAKTDIDHLVALKESWGSGAFAWTAQRRQAYANDLDDPRALVAVSAAQNRAKGHRDPAQWLPADVTVHCRYIAEWVAIKLRWALTADRREFQTLNRIAAGCPDSVLGVIPAPQTA